MLVELSARDTNEKLLTALRKIGARHLSAYWGGWFAKIGDGDMKETNLNLFYQFGQTLNTLYDSIEVGIKAVNVFAELMQSQSALVGFLAETESYKLLLEDTRASVQALLNTINEIMRSTQVDVERPLTQEEVTAMFNSKWELDNSFEREYRNLSVFAVTPKALLSTRLLIQRAEHKFGDQTRSVFTDRVIYDLRQSGRCLAFEVPTAMAFHVMRATETLIKGYYEVLAGQPWPYDQRDWGSYIRELGKCPDVNKVITGRLTEIKNLNRNPLIHPDEIVPLEEATVIFDLCNGVIYYMAEEIRKRRP